MTIPGVAERLGFYHRAQQLRHPAFLAVLFVIRGCVSLQSVGRPAQRMGRGLPGTEL